MADTMRLFEGTEAVSRANFNDRLAAGNAMFDAHTARLDGHDTALEAAQSALAAETTARETHEADAVRHVTAAERAAWDGKAAGSHNHDADYAAKSTESIAAAALPRAGGTMTGQLIAVSNTAYTTRQVRNIIISMGTDIAGSNGDVIHVYK